MRKMIAVFGGTFDPIHFGHLRVALELKERLALDRLHLLPCHRPPHRVMPETDSAHRLAMVQLAVAGDAAFRVDDRELKQTGPSYTVKTLESLREEMGAEPVLCLAMGADAFLAIDSWYRWQDLLGLAHIVVMTRPGWQMPGADVTGRALSSVASNLLQKHAVANVEQLQMRPAGNILPLEVTALEISATQIRRLISTGRSARFLLPQAVLQYIHQHKLYTDNC